MYRLLALAKYDERYVIPPAHAEQAHSLEELGHRVHLDYEAARHGRLGPVRRGLRRPDPDRGRELPRCCATGRPADTMAAPEDKAGRVNLLNWDGKGSPTGLFPHAGRGRSRAVGGDTPDTSDDGATGPGGTGGLTGGRTTDDAEPRR